MTCRLVPLRLAALLLFSFTSAARNEPRRNLKLAVVTLGVRRLDSALGCKVHVQPLRAPWPLVTHCKKRTQKESGFAASESSVKPEHSKVGPHPFQAARARRGLAVSRYVIALPCLPQTLKNSMRRKHHAAF